jgi:ATP-dependent Clp protease adaptor protein ClpS
MVKTEEKVEELTNPNFFVDRPWITIVWDDPVNLMTYVTYVLMLQIHNEGKAVVSSGRREEMERDVQRLHEKGLWATLQRDDH